MMRSPEESFNAQDFAPTSSQEEYTPAERLFMQKYLGVGSTTEEVAKDLGLKEENAPAPVSREEAEERIKNGEKYVIRFKTPTQHISINQFIISIGKF